MSELEKIQSIVESKVFNKEYSDEELDKFSNLVGYILKVKENVKNILVLNRDYIDFLISKDIISNLDGKLIESYKIAIKVGKELSDESLNRINSIFEKVSERLKEINNSLENTNAKLLFEKIKKGLKNLDSEELDLLFELIRNSEYSLEEKRDLLIYASLNVIKFIDEYSADYEEIEDTEKGIAEEQCVELFGKYGYPFDKLKKEQQEEIMKKGNYEQIDNIFKLLKRENIDLCNNCGQDILYGRKQKCMIQILVKSNANCIQRIIDFAKTHDFIVDDMLDFYTFVKTPPLFILRKRDYKNRNKTGGVPPRDNKEEIYGSHQDFFDNVKFFEEMYERVYPNSSNKEKFLKTFFDKDDSLNLLTYSIDKNRTTARILTTYGLDEKVYFDVARSVFKGANHADILDFMIEQYMLDYVKDNPSILCFAMDGKFGKQFDYLYLASKMKETLLDTRWKTDLSGNRRRKIVLADHYKDMADCIVNENPKALPERIVKSQAFKENGRFKLFEEKVQYEPFNILPAINEIKNPNKDTPLKILEEHFKVDEYLYEIAGIRISRLKVLRVYSALSSIPIRTSDTEKMKLYFALARNSYMTKEDVDMIMEEFDRVKKQARGL